MLVEFCRDDDIIGDEVLMADEADHPCNATSEKNNDIHK